MVQEKIIRSMIAPVVAAGILILAVLTAIPSNALMTHSSSEYEKCVKSSSNCFLLNNESSNNGNGATSQESSTGNAAQGASTNGEGGPSGQTTGGTVAQESSSQAAHCKAAITSLSASYYPPYRNWMVRGQLTCGDFGLSGKTIILTNSESSDVEKLMTVVTREDGYFSTSLIKPTATTAKPGSPLSAWYLGGTDEGGTASKTITLPPTS